MVWKEIRDVRDLLCYDEVEPDKVHGVLEHHIGNELRKGREDMLSFTVPSQWGEVTLFDLCLTFGYHDTAWALAEGGVRGCRVEAYHLGRYASLGGNDGHIGHMLCECKGSNTCKYCGFGFAAKQGIWMQNWDADLSSATRAAREATRKLFVSRTLSCLQSGRQLPFALSEEAMALVLDVAILTGDKEAASHLARLCKLRPLRRWKAFDLFGMDGRLIVLKNPDVLLAALSAGIDLTKLWWKGGWGDLPFREAVALSGRWSDFEELLPPPPRPWTPPPANSLAGYLITSKGPGAERCAELCPERVHEALVAGVALKDFRWLCQSLLDTAIRYGQAECAALCVAAGIEILSLQKEEFQEEGWVASVQERQAAAEVAAREALALSWRQQCERGVAVYQVMKVHMDGRHFPLDLVDQVLLYATEVPYIVNKLDLLEEVKGWHVDFRTQALRPEAFANGDQYEVKDAADMEALPVIEEIVDHDAEPAVRDPELLREQEEHDWADTVVDRILTSASPGSDDHAEEQEDEKVWIFPFTRIPEQFTRELREGPQLRAVREAMSQEGCRFELETSHAKVFVWPHQYARVLEELKALELKGLKLETSHLVILDSLMVHLEDIVVLIPGKLKCKIQHASVHSFSLAAEAEDSETDDSALWSWTDWFEVEEIFLCLVKCYKPDTAENQSTRGSRKGRNPSCCELASDFS